MKQLFLSLLALTFFVSCNEDDDMDSTSMLTLNLSGLEDLGSGFAYEGWIMVNGSPVTTGTFTVNSNGELSQTHFEIDASDLASAAAFVLSIEPVPDTDPAPSNTKILGGAFSGSSASVNIMHEAAFGQGFGTATGSYILKTPTTTTDEDDLSGVWFLDPSGPTATLGLPDLSNLEGWVYEGWAVIDGVPVSTGRFNSASGADDSGIYSGTDASAPPFPGEDFIMNAPSGLTFPTSLIGGMIVISIEPEPDNSSAPFTLKPLAGMVASGLEPGTLAAMDNIAASTYPSGTVIR